ncbi:hypothetical protein EBT31_21965 [bacterium]|nr:hypothetical protein [bacterium]
MPLAAPPLRSDRPGGRQGGVSRGCRYSFDRGCRGADGDHDNRTLTCVFGVEAARLVAGVEVDPLLGFLGEPGPVAVRAGALVGLGAVVPAGRFDQVAGDIHGAQSG